MIEIEPWAPYGGDVAYPTLLPSGDIELRDTRSSIFGAHTAGLALDDTPLDTPFIFTPIRGEETLNGARDLYFLIEKIGDKYFIPDSCEFYGELAAQMLGALRYEPGASDARFHEFNFNEQVIGESIYGDNVHDDQSTNLAADRAALVAT